jgi:hAT family C-terminal dimerisation region
MIVPCHCNLFQTPASCIVLLANTVGVRNACSTKRKRSEPSVVARRQNLPFITRFVVHPAALLPIITHYIGIISAAGDCMKSEENCSADFVSEMKHATIVLYNLAPDAARMLDAAIVLRQLQAAFPRVRELFQIALTSSVSTASCKRSFSCKKTKVKMYTRTTP